MPRAFVDVSLYCRMRKFCVELSDDANAKLASLRWICDRADAVGGLLGGDSKTTCGSSTIWLARGEDGGESSAVISDLKINDGHDK